MKSKTIESILKYTVLSGLFASLFIPLYVENSFFFPFITGKAFAFRIIVEIIFASWVLLFLRDKNYLPKWSSIQVAFTIFTLVILVADIMGVSFLRSFWSNFERMDGWVSLIHLWGYFMVMTSVLSFREGDRRLWNYFLNTSLVVCIIVAIYAFAQLFGWAEIHQGSTRLDASLGNAIYLAAYMLFNAFISLYFASDTASKGKKGYAWSYLALSLVFMFIMFETATRGAVIGLVLGILVGLVILAIWGNGKKVKGISSGIFIFIILCGLLFWTNRNASFIQKNGTLKRFADISLSDTKTQARGYIWPMAVDGVFSTKKTTIIGWGQENFNYIFNANYNPKMWMHEQWFDRAHDSYLDWMVAGGLLGLISYLAIFITAFVSIIRSSLNINEKALFMAMIIGYAVQAIFTFDNLTSYMYFIIILAFIAGMRATRPQNWISKVTFGSSNNYHIFVNYLYTPVILILFIITIYSINITPIRANTKLIASMIACSGNGNNLSPEPFKVAVAVDKYMANQEIREQALACATNVLRSNVPQNVKVDFMTMAATQIDAQLNQTPDDARIYYLGGVFMNNIGNWNAGKILLEKAVLLSPGKQSMIIELVTNYINTGKIKESVEIMKKTYESAPDNINSKIAYISTLILNNEESKAKEIFSKEPEIFLDERIVNSYVNIKAYDKAINIYKKLIEKDPENQRNYLQLAGIYYASGNKYQTIEELKLIAKKFPEIKKQMDDAIKEVQSK